MIYTKGENILNSSHTYQAQPVIVIVVRNKPQIVLGLVILRR